MYGPYERKVQYYETDRMKIVHHSNYARWFEEARLDYLEKAGLPYDLMEEKGILIPVLSVTSNFRMAFSFGDTFQVYLACTKFNGIKCEFEYKVLNKENGDVYTTGSSSHCFVDKNMKPFNMKKLYPDMYNILSGLVVEKGQVK